MYWQTKSANIELWDRYSALYSTNNTRNIRISSSEIAIQLDIQHYTHFEYRAMGSTFSSAFENIYLECRAVRSTFISAFQIIHNLNIELRVRNSALLSKIFILNIELRDRRSALHSIPYTLWMSSCEFNIQLCIQNHNTLNIELWVRHSALHSKTFIFNFELWDRYSALHSTPYTLWISSYRFDIQLCIRKHTS